MKKQLSDQQLDKLMQSLLNEAAANEATLNQVAESPATWWAVQRQISAQKSTIRSPWPPMPKLWRLLLVGVPVAATVLLAVIFFATLATPVPENNAQTVYPAAEKPLDPVASNVITGNHTTATSRPVNITAVVRSKTNAQRQMVPVKMFSRPVKKERPAGTLTAKKSTEIKTDFIALSYAQNPESGQVVRVKVPSSMMVTLGLVATVEKPSNLVDAEVIVGDDGLTHAIRFIHQK